MSNGRGNALASWTRSRRLRPIVLRRLSRGRPRGVARECRARVGLLNGRTHVSAAFGSAAAERRPPEHSPQKKAIEWAPISMIPSWWRAWRPMLMAGALALCTMGVSMNIAGRREHRAETVDLQQAILRAEPGLLDGRPTYFPQFQNRILFPILLAAVV